MWLLELLLPSCFLQLHSAEVLFYLSFFRPTLEENKLHRMVVVRNKLRVAVALMDCSAAKFSFMDSRYFFCYF